MRKCAVTGAQNLLIHPGGLGDICLSESTFLSLYRHFGHTMQAVGRKSVFELFQRYFTTVHSIDGREFSYLFSREGEAARWETIVLIGKDRSGDFRGRLKAIAREVIFIEMYPDAGKVHVETFQLDQLSRYGITPFTLRFEKRPGDRVIVYPERPYRKKKWPAEHFVRLYQLLQKQRLHVILMASPALELPISGVRSYEGLDEIADFFFQAGGLFFSNDSGMAHLAAHCGLETLTLFYDTDPAVWRPRGSHPVRYDDLHPSVEEMAALIKSQLLS